MRPGEEILNSILSFELKQVGWVEESSLWGEEEEKKSCDFEGAFQKVVVWNQQRKDPHVP